ncbi:MAG TPA: quinol:cytochrome C oxidoreductase [Bacteroidia bacterium]|nr:quinol:cytochrome C oxidoreductase [Bacteroidia bacterium]
MNLNYTLSPKTKNICLGLIGGGLIVTLLGIFWHAQTPVQVQRIWSNIWVNIFFFFSISLLATFFYAVQYAAEAAWAVAYKRIMEAVMKFLPVGAVLVFTYCLLGVFHVHHTWKWLEPAVVASDKVLQNKSAFLNPGMFLGMTAAFLIAYVAYQRWTCKVSLEADQGGDGVQYWKTNQRKAAIFLVFFGFTSVVGSWFWLMSIDAHWFSTLFGWYVFAGQWVTAIIAFNLIGLHLKSKGQAEFLNDSHQHDMGKWMFAISFLWTYLWFSQFMLTWYANLPEEVTYYQARWDDYRGLLWTMFFVNFALPMLMLMSRDAKRNRTFIFIVGIIILFFHWADLFVMIMPGTVGAEGHIGLMEIGMFVASLGGFSWYVLNQLSKAPLLVKNHPYLGETLHFHI